MGNHALRAVLTDPVRFFDLGHVKESWNSGQGVLFSERHDITGQGDLA